MMGRFEEALSWVDKAIEFGNRADDRYDQLGDRFARGDILHQCGRFADAEAAFAYADQVRDKEGQRIPNNYFFWEFPWCELQITLGRHQEAKRRALQALARPAEWADSLLAPAQMHLAAGEAIVAELLPHHGGDQAEADRHLQEALDLLRRATHQVYLPRGLLVRATLHRLQGNLKRADFELNEVMRIATRSDMRLYEADCRLELARLRRVETYTDQARSNLAQARQIIASTGYHRRDADVAELEAALT